MVSLYRQAGLASSPDDGPTKVSISLRWSLFGPVADRGYPEETVSFLETGSPSWNRGVLAGVPVSSIGCRAPRFQEELPAPGEKKLT